MAVTEQHVTLRFAAGNTMARATINEVDLNMAWLQIGPMPLLEIGTTVYMRIADSHTVEAELSKPMDRDAEFTAIVQNMPLTGLTRYIRDADGKITGEEIWHETEWLRIWPKETK